MFCHQLKLFLQNKITKILVLMKDSSTSAIKCEIHDMSGNMKNLPCLLCSTQTVNSVSYQLIIDAYMKITTLLQNKTNSNGTYACV